MTFYPFRLASGRISKATLQGSSAYLVSNLTRQSDQKPHILWTLLTPVWDDGARRSIGANGTAKWFGKPTITLTVPVMTPGMLDYWRLTFLGTGAQSAAVTFEIPDKRQSTAGQATVFQGIMQAPSSEQLRLVRATYWEAVPFVCTLCEIQ